MISSSLYWRLEGANLFESTLRTYLGWNVFVGNKAIVNYLPTGSDMQLLDLIQEAYSTAQPEYGWIWIEVASGIFFITKKEPWEIHHGSQRKLHCVTKGGAFECTFNVFATVTMKDLNSPTGKELVEMKTFHLRPMLS